MEFDFNVSTTVNSTGSFDEYCFLNPEDPFCGPDYEPMPFFKLTAGKIVSAIAMSILIVVALTGNILLCTAFLFYRRLRKTTNYFIISLAMSDILVATIAMPMWLSYELTGWESLPIWIDFHKLLMFWNWFDILAGVSSITNLTAISIDRFFSIITPLLHRTRMTRSIAIAMVVVAWLYSIILASLSLMQWRYYSALVCSLGFFLPLFIIVATYVTIYMQVRNGRFSSSADKDWNLERTLVIVISIFVICWTPFFLFTLLYHHCESCPFDQKIVIHMVSFMKWMHYLNSGCNPFIYGIFNRNFKHAFRALLKQCCSLPGKYTESTNLTTDMQDSSVKSQIINLRRKLRFKRGRSRGSSSLLVTDTDTSSICVTIAPSSNRSSRSLNNNPSSNGTPRINRDPNSSIAEANGSLHMDVLDKLYRRQNTVPTKSTPDPIPKRTHSQDEPTQCTKSSPKTEHCATRKRSRSLQEGKIMDDEGLALLQSSFQFQPGKDDIHRQHLLDSQESCV